MALGRPAAPAFTHLKQVDPKAFKIQGALFLASDVQHKFPMAWEYGEQVLQQYLNPGELLGPTLLRIGEEVKRVLIEQLRIGGGKSTARPLTPYTNAARAKRGIPPDTFLYDTGELARGLEVVLAKPGEGGMGSPMAAGQRGYSGFVIRDRGDTNSSHSTERAPVGLWKLLNILCQTGLAIYAEDLTPEKVARIMAFRDRMFEGSEEFLGRGKITEAEFISKNYPEWKADSMSASGYTKGGRQVPQSDVDFARGIARDRNADAGSKSWETDGLTAKQAQALDKAKRVKAAAGTRKKPLLFIPPRPFINEEMRQKLTEVASVLTERFFGQSALLAATTLGSEPWNPGMVKKYEADMKRTGGL